MQVEVRCGADGQCTIPTTLRRSGRLSLLHGLCKLREISVAYNSILLLGVIGSMAQSHMHHIDVSLVTRVECEADNKAIHNRRDCISVSLALLCPRYADRAESWLP